MSRTRGKTWTGKEVLGKAFVDRMNEAVLVIGRDSWTRQEMVEQLKCGNFHAARILSKAAEALQVEDAASMAVRVGMDDLFGLPRVGVTTMYTWMCVVDRGLKRDPLAWLSQAKPRTLVSEKSRVLREQEAEAEAARKKR